MRLYTRVCRIYCPTNDASRVRSVPRNDRKLEAASSYAPSTLRKDLVVPMIALQIADTRCASPNATFFGRANLVTGSWSDCRGWNQGFVNRERPCRLCRLRPDRDRDADHRVNVGSPRARPVGGSRVGGRAYCRMFEGAPAEQRRGADRPASHLMRTATRPRAGTDLTAPPWSLIQRSCKLLRDQNEVPWPPLPTYECCRLLRLAYQAGRHKSLE
jgi:hypothetical protein